MQLHQPARKRQSEARALTLGLARLGLLELLEDAIADRQARCPGRCRATDTRTSPSTCAAMTSIPPPAGVNLTALLSRLKTTWRTRRSSPTTVPTPSVASEMVTPSLRCPLADDHDAALERLGQGEGRHLELDLAGLDLGQVEHVIDERQKVACRREDVVEVLGLLLVDLAEELLAQHLEKPLMALSGVRSSCDMLARNSDLWRLAASSSRDFWSSSSRAVASSEVRCWTSLSRFA